MSDPGDFQAKLNVLCDAFAAQLPIQLEKVEEAWRQLPRGEWGEAEFQTLYGMVHSLTGSGKIFGIALLSDAARNLEDYLRLLAQGKTAPSEEQCERIRGLLNELHRAHIRPVIQSGIHD